jgi:hypothetical protein
MIDISESYPQTVLGNSLWFDPYDKATYYICLSILLLGRMVNGVLQLHLLLLSGCHRCLVQPVDPCQTVK